jgi:hypothetical protein
MAQGPVWSFFVVLLKPQFGLFADFIQSLKHKHIEYRFTVAAIESFNETILHRPPWLNELELTQPASVCGFHAAVFRPPLVIGRVADLVFTTDVLYRRSCFHRFQNRDDLMFAEFSSASRRGEALAAKVKTQ